MELESYIDFLINNNNPIPKHTLHCEVLRMGESSLVKLNYILNDVDRALLKGFNYALIDCSYVNITECHNVYVINPTAQSAQVGYTLEHYLEDLKDNFYFQECNEEEQKNIIQSIHDLHAGRMYFRGTLFMRYEARCRNVMSLRKIIVDEIERLKPQSTIKPTTTENENTAKQFYGTMVTPDEIFQKGAYDKLIFLEKLLFEDKFIDDNNQWIAKKKNNAPDIKSLQIFIKGLQQNNYFLPKKNSNIRQFFESRYSIKIGQSFEPARLNKLKDEYKIKFFNYKIESQ